MDLFWAMSFDQADTAFVVKILICLFALGFLVLPFLWLKPSNHLSAWLSGSSRRFVVALPSLLATIGVVGTFFGIWLGLQAFDVTAIDESVPELLVGLKTAFITSLWGMGLSVIFRLFSTLVQARMQSQDSVKGVLELLLQEQKHVRLSTESGFKEIKDAISGDSSETIVGLLTQKQLDSEGHHKEHIKELRDFANHMVENTNGKLVEALREVITDFNKNLTEQFGENFKQLNEAVHALVVWQNKYKDHVDTLQKRIDNAVSALDDSEKSLGKVARSTAEIPEAIKVLDPVMAAINSSLDRINQDLEAYAELHDKARSAFPIVNSNLDAITESLKLSTGLMTERLEGARDIQERSHKRLEESFSQIANTAEASQQTFNTSVDKTMKRIEDELHGAAKNLATNLEESARETEGRLKQQIMNVDESLGNELEEALKIMASNLGGMSEQFSRDYRPLTEELGRILQIASSANNSVRNQGRTG